VERRYIEKASGNTPNAKNSTKNGATKRYGAPRARRSRRAGALAADALLDEDLASANAL
jgi:hypothetical protein